MSAIRGSKDLRTFEIAVDGIFFFDCQDAKQLVSSGVDQCNVFADGNAVSEFPGAGQCDRYRPEHSVSQFPRQSASPMKPSSGV
jgi:hypothetical protein